MNHVLGHRRVRRLPGTRSGHVGRLGAAPRRTRAACRIALLLVACAFHAAGPAAAAFPPANDGWVTDLAGLLTPDEERALEALMTSYEQGSGNEIALLTVPDLGGRALESYALETARAWGIGKEGRHNGALILVAQAERKIRIEVGRGLEGNLTDSICGRIIRGVIAPAFKAGRFHEGLRAGVEATHAAAGGDYARIPRDRRAKRSAEAFVVPVIILAILLFSGIARAASGQRPRRDEGLLPWLILGALSGRRSGSRGWHGGSGGGGFGGFGGGGGFSGGGASGGW